MTQAFDYLYRDASNYKAYRSLRLTGKRWSKADIQKVREKLDCGEFFIPEQVGLEAIDDLAEQFGFSEDDDAWHEIAGVRHLAEGEELLETDGDALLQAFLAVDRWETDPRSQKAPSQR